MTRRLIAISALVLALSIPGTAAVAEDGSGTASCPNGMTGAQFGAHVADMARMGHIGTDMNPGMHQGYSPMAR